MTNISEDYVSFEIAKLLKEKGFDIECNTAYHNNILIDYTLFGFCIDVELISAPTLQMTMKWLREVHNIHITILYSSFLYGTHPYYWSVDKIDTIPRANTQIEISTNTHNYSFVHYETACDDAIKYCLENLI